MVASLFLRRACARGGATAVGGQVGRKEEAKRHEGARGGACATEAAASGVWGAGACVGTGLLFS